jgi:hypothetical protein
VVLRAVVLLGGVALLGLVMLPHYRTWVAVADAALPQDSIAALQRAVAASEYRASESAGELQAPNRAQNLRTYFGPRGIRVHDRTAADGAQLVSMELRAVGRGESLERVAPGEVSSEAARVEIARPGLVEWYENRPEGLEQGFTLESRPAGDGPLLLDLEISGAEANALGAEIALVTRAGRRLSYGKLEVRDAHDRSLGARLEAPAHDRIRLVVDDAGAAYPVQIDPLLRSLADGAIESDQNDADLGNSIASAGDVNGDGYADVIVGARLYDAGDTDEGAAFLFLGSANGIGFFEDPDTAAARFESNQGSAWLGTSVASAGDVNGDGYSDVIVGAPRYGGALEGAAFVFLGSAGIANGNPVSAHARLVSDLGFASMGQSVASAGDVNGDGYSDVIVGAQDYSTGTGLGAAFVFHGSANGVADGNPATAATRLVDSIQVSLMGNSVASAGDVNADGFSDVIVGAYFYTAGIGQNREGAAFVFLGSATGVAHGTPASAHAQLESNQANAEFGWSVAPAGDVNGDGFGDVVVGSRLYNGGHPQEGGAYVFVGSASGIADGNPTSARARLEPNATGAQGGSGVAAGDVNGDGYSDVIVGAQNYNGGQSLEGGVFVYLGGPAFGALDPPVFRLLESDEVGAAFGASVGAGDVNGDGYADVMAGANSADGGGSNEGVAALYLGGGGTILASATPAFNSRLESNKVSTGLGESVASAGDVNGDGFADVIVGAPGYDFGAGDDRGAAFVFLGSIAGIPNGNPGTAATRLEADEANLQTRFGTSVASAGDVNGDGYADVIVGAPFYVTESGTQGAAFLYLGSISGIPHGDLETAAVQLEAAPGSGQEFGARVASAGDVNGDGYSDVIVGAYREDAAYLFFGSPTLPSGSVVPPTRLVSEPFSSFGLAVGSAGDVNGDGFADALVAAPFQDVGLAEDAGSVFIFHGSATGISSGDASSADGRIDGISGASLGWGAGSVGDVNCDGYGDVAAANLPVAGAQVGVFHGSDAGIQGTSMLTAHSVVSAGGFPLGTAGDVNGDGCSDVLMGNSLVLGSGAGIPAGSISDVRSASFGSVFTTAAAGDVDGDGFADVIAGDPDFNGGQVDEGAAHVFLGNGSHPGRLVLAAQHRVDSSRIAPWGIADQAGVLLLSMNQFHPEGSRARVMLEAEACPAPLPFGHAACLLRRSGPWILPGGHSFFPVMGIAPDRLYRWRMRSLYAHASVIQPGITAPPNPAHGPWRRLDAQTIGADIRTGPVAADTDGDGLADALDNCAFFANAAQLDADQDGRGDACECTDENGDGFNTVSDLVAINVAVFNPQLATPLCDGNNDDECNVNDIIAANVEIFSAGSTSTCGRQPLPGP